MATRLYTHFHINSVHITRGRDRYNQSKERHAMFIAFSIFQHARVAVKAESHITLILSKAMYLIHLLVGEHLGNVKTYILDIRPLVHCHLGV